MADDEAMDIKAAGVLAQKMNCAEVALLYVKTLERSAERWAELEAMRTG